MDGLELKKASQAFLSTKMFTSFWPKLPWPTSKQSQYEPYSNELVFLQ